MASSKTRTRKGERPAQPDPGEKSIRLNDLIPNRNVDGGRRTVFGSPPATPSGKRKNQK